MSNRKACITCGQEFTGDDVMCPVDGTILTPLAKDPYLGNVLADRYEILEIIGGGGMGLVYKARHILMNRIVAIKMLHQHLTNSTEALKRFKLEAEAASCLSLPNILTIYDFGVSDEGQPYMVMDYLEGTSLADVLEAETRLPVSRALGIFIQCCAGLAHAHQKGVIHRDLKPSNIMLVNYADDQIDFVKIVDFGIAKLLNRADGTPANLTRTGEVYGSPLYMSPEQCRGQELDARSDLYAFGCVMYKTLSGLPVFTGSEMIELLFKQVSEMPKHFAEACPDADIPGELENIVFTALQKEPNKRYPSMNELKDVLEAFKRKVDGRDNTDTGEFPVPEEDQTSSGGRVTSWAAPKPAAAIPTPKGNSANPALVPGPLASALAHRVHDQGHQQASPASSTTSSAPPPAVRPAAAAQDAAAATATPRSPAPPAPAVPPVAQPIAPNTASASSREAQSASGKIAGGNGAGAHKEQDAGTWSQSWNTRPASPELPADGGIKPEHIVPQVVSSTTLDAIPTPNVEKAIEAVRSHQPGELPRATARTPGADKLDWMMTLEGIFHSRTMIIAVVAVIFMGVVVAALYIHNHTSGTAPNTVKPHSATNPGSNTPPAGTAHPAQIAVPPATDSTQPDSDATDTNDTDTRDAATNVKPDTHAQPLIHHSNAGTSESASSSPVRNNPRSTPRTEHHTASSKHATTPATASTDTEEVHKSHHTHHSSTSASSHPRNIRRHAYSMYEF